MPTAPDKRMPDKQTAAEEPDGSRLESVLASTFGYPSFRPLQREIVEAALHGRDVFVLMPTGGGKSLCYQLPALLREGVTVVVSPLIALMKDQVDRLQGLGVPAACINSSMSAAEMARAQAALASKKLKLVYVAPERLMMPGFQRLLAMTSIAAFAIDEAHCISEWGHDFRPEYRALVRLRGRFPSTPISAFTATATRRVQADIIEQLRLENPAQFRGSFDRANLYYDVRPKLDAYRHLLAYLRHHRGESGIIYCLARQTTEDLAARLCADGVRAAAYHAGLPPEDRRARQDAFSADAVDVIVATIAFGMGIDKPNVRFVVHYDLPRNLEGYYQESGRAGRDGRPSDCILFYSYADAARYEHFIRQRATESERRIGRVQLQQMVNWAESAVCRRRALLAYFDETLEDSHRHCCDVCSASLELVDATAPAQAFLACLQQSGQRFGVAYVIRILRGSRDERILAARHDRLPSHGLGRDLTRPQWHAIADGLIHAGYVRMEQDEFRVLRLTERGRKALAERESIALRLPEPVPPEPAPARTGLRPAPSAVTDTVSASLELFRAGRDVQEIAKARKLTPRTVAEQLARAIEAGELVDMSRLVAPEKQRAIESVIAELGPGLLKPLKERLGERFSYDEIRYVCALAIRRSGSGGTGGRGSDAVGDKQ